MHQSSVSMMTLTLLGYPPQNERSNPIPKRLRRHAGTVDRYGGGRLRELGLAWKGDKGPLNPPCRQERRLAERRAAKRARLRQRRHYGMVTS